MIVDLLKKENLTQSDIISLLHVTGDDTATLFSHADKIKQDYFGNKVFIRGLIEISNICEKNCYYCGLRHDNHLVSRYMINEDEVLDLVRFAIDNGLGSVVIQSGEITTPNFIDTIDRLIREIMRLSDYKMGITLSCGEQKEETYRRWFESGAHRYLLRIETSNKALYERIHPKNDKHDFKTRMDSLISLKKIGYHFGSGIMVGLPFQTDESLAADLLFLKEMDVDMVGLGPYLEHEQTPLLKYSSLLYSQEQRFALTLKMIAILRILMKDINIAATTALQVIHPDGREQALKCGANVIMPNITGPRYKTRYTIYNNKPGLSSEAIEIHSKVKNSLQMLGLQIAFHERGDSLHFKNRMLINKV